MKSGKHQAESCEVCIMGVNSVEKMYHRKIHKNSHRCAAKFLSEEVGDLIG